MESDDGDSSTQPNGEKVAEMEQALGGPAELGAGASPVRDRSRTPPRRFSQGEYREEVFNLFGRTSVETFANRFANVEANVGLSDSDVSFRDQIVAAHNVAKALVTTYPNLFGEKCSKSLQ